MFSQIFCPLNEDGEIYYKKYEKDSEYFTAIVTYYLVLVFPIVVCFLLDLYFIIRAFRGAQIIQIPSVQSLVYNLRIIPLIFFTSMAPVSLFFLIHVFANKSFRILLLIGGLFQMSCGLFFTSFLLWYKSYLPSSANNSTLRGDAKKQSSGINPIIFESELIRPSEELRKPPSSFVSSSGDEVEVVPVEENSDFIPGSWK